MTEQGSHTESTGRDNKSGPVFPLLPVSCDGTISECGRDHMFVVCDAFGYSEVAGCTCESQPGAGGSHIAHSSGQSVKADTG